MLHISCPLMEQSFINLAAIVVETLKSTSCLCVSPDLMHRVLKTNRLIYLLFVSPRLKLHSLCILLIRSRLRSRHLDEYQSTSFLNFVPVLLFISLLFPPFLALFSSRRHFISCYFCSEPCKPQWWESFCRRKQFFGRVKAQNLCRNQLKLM